MSSNSSTSSTGFSFITEEMKALHLYTPLKLGTEVGIAAAVYFVVVVYTFVPILKRYMQSKSEIWERMSQRQGQVLTNMADEAVLTLSLSLHHLVGGFVMVAGLLMNNPTVWTRGLAIEIGFEVVDLITLVLNAWPYTVVQPNLRFVTVLHHIPGSVCAPFLIMAGFHHNTDLQRIGGALLWAGGVSLLCDGIKQTRDLETQMGQWLILHIINMTGVVIARFLVFPLASYGLLATAWEEAPQEIAVLASVGVGSMTIFNVIVIAIMTEKLVKNGYIFLKTKSNHRSKEVKLE